MEKIIYTILMLFSIALIDATAIGIDQTPKSTKNGYENPKITQLHFYLHDIVSGPNPTNVPIAFANSTATSPTYFGLIAAIDDPLTEGPDPNSEKVGRAQGLFGSTSLQEISYHMTFNLVFTGDKYNGSTLSVVGQNPFLHEYRELAVVGGTGFFQLARGTATLKTHTFNATSGDAVVEYNVTVLHY